MIDPDDAAALGDVYDAIDEVVGFGEAILEVVGRLVPNDMSTFNLTELGPHRAVFDVRPAPHPVHRACIDEFVRLQPEHPLITRFAAIDAPPPTRWSDVLDPRRLRQTELYRVYYRPMGVRHQMALKVAGRGGSMTTIALSRARRPFSDDERDRCARVLPHLRRAHRLAERMRGAGADGELAGIEPSADALAASGLTTRQVQVAVELCRGGTNAQLAARLGIGTGTLRKHLEQVFLAFDVDNRTSAVAAIRASAARDPGSARGA